MFGVCPPTSIKPVTSDLTYLVFALVCGLFALVASFTMREGKINRRSNKRGGN